MLVSAEHINHALKFFKTLYGKVVSEFQKDIWLLSKKDVILLFANRYIYDDLKGEYIAPESITNETDYRLRQGNGTTIFSKRF